MNIVIQKISFIKIIFRYFLSNWVLLIAVDFLILEIYFFCKAIFTGILREVILSEMQLPLLIFTME